MPRITFIENNEKSTLIDVPEGWSVLEAAQQAKLPLEGSCGGSLACATCHVSIDPAWAELVPAASMEEEDMLDLTPCLTKTSRLGCQIKLTPELDGLVVRLVEV